MKATPRIQSGYYTRMGRAVVANRVKTPRLGNYTFLTLCVEIKKTHAYAASIRAILGRFSNAAADVHGTPLLSVRQTGNKRDAS